MTKIKLNTGVYPQIACFQPNYFTIQDILSISDPVIFAVSHGTCVIGVKLCSHRCPERTATASHQ